MDTECGTKIGRESDSRSKTQHSLSSMYMYIIGEQIPGGHLENLSKGGEEGQKLRLKSLGGASLILFPQCSQVPRGARFRQRG